MKTRQVRLFRVVRNGLGVLPKGYTEGVIVGLTASEQASLEANKTLVQCFEAVEIIPPPILTEEDPSGEVVEKKDVPAVVRGEQPDIEVNRVHDLRSVENRDNADGPNGPVQQGSGSRRGAFDTGYNVQPTAGQGG